MTTFLTFAAENTPSTAESIVMGVIGVASIAALVVISIFDGRQ